MQAAPSRRGSMPEMRYGARLQVVRGVPRLFCPRRRRRAFLRNLPNADIRTNFRRTMSKYDQHHIVPRARCREFGISPKFRGNALRVKTTKHRAWHTLFGAQTPEEAIETIRREWSLSEEGQAEFHRLSGNTILMKRSAKQ